MRLVCNQYNTFFTHVQRENVEKSFKTRANQWLFMTDLFSKAYNKTKL